MTWRVLFAAQARTVPNADLSIEKAELAARRCGDHRVCAHPRRRWRELGASADGLLTLGIGLDSTRRSCSCPTAEQSSASAMAINHLDLAAATELGIPVSNTYFCHEDVANHTLLLLLACARKLDATAPGVERRSLAPRSARGHPTDLRSDARVDRIRPHRVGGGPAWRRVGPRRDDHGSVSSDDQTLARDGVRRVGLDELLSRSDFVSLHLPLSEETHHLIGESELRAMRPSAFLLNTARGGLVDERALVRALREGWIAGAGLDVFEAEPADPD